MPTETQEAERRPLETPPRPEGSALPRHDLSDVFRFIRGPIEPHSYAIIGLFLLGCIGFLYIARPFFLPVVLALILSFLFRPVVKALARIHIPEAIGAAVVLLLALTAVGNGVSRLTQPATEWITQAPDVLRKMEEKARRMIRPASMQNVTKPSSEAPAASVKPPASEGPARVEIQQVNLIDRLFSQTTSFMGGLVETIVLLYFLLTCGERLMQKLVDVLPNSQDKEEIAEVTGEVQHKISTFLLTITIINACLGLVVGVALYLAGMPNPVLWGVMASLLNFIPYFGPFTGVLILGVAGFVTFDSLGRMILPPLLYLGFHGLESNIITPVVLGRRLTLNPLLIFISLMFWTWMWGIPGALLSVPLLMMLKIFFDHYKPLGPIGELMGE
jgi:predicted PurR-regulated permease PerM